MNIPNYNQNSSFIEKVIMLISSSGADKITKDTMTLAVKMQYVQERHNYTITTIAKGRNAGKLKTYVGSPRKEMVRNDESALYDALYNYYKAQEIKQHTFLEAMEAWLIYKEVNHNLTNKSITSYRNVLKRFFPEEFFKRDLRTIKKAEMEKLFVECTRKVKPTKDGLKKTLQYVKNVFEFAMDKEWCRENPATVIKLKSLYSLCKIEKKADEEKAFSPEEIEILQKDAREHTDNPRALMILMASETGMRVGELCALRWGDVKSNYLHIHRQQLSDNTKKGSDRLYEVGYTKDERENPHNGRKFPITNQIKEILELAQKLPGESEYIFHDGDGWVKKDGYLHYLAIRCKANGIKTTNNHAFRMAFNDHLIREGMNSSDRALILGHSIETNERYYANRDMRQFDNVYLQMMDIKEKNPQ
jgi:integrase